MPSVTYIALREIASGHSLSTEYDLDFGAVAISRSVKAVNSSQRSLGGAVKTVHKRNDVMYKVTTGNIDLTAAAIDYWREFLASVSGGEQFTFDPYGTAASPDNPLTCILDTDSWDESREGMTDDVRISFDVYVVP